MTNTIDNNDDARIGIRFLPAELCPECGVEPIVGIGPRNGACWCPECTPAEIPEELDDAAEAVAQLNRAVWSAPEEFCPTIIGQVLKALLAIMRYYQPAAEVSP